jgi:POT family proton-dependent oligopeptide transporter
MLPVLRHPPGLALLFFTELWERFSYYGMRSLLVLFAVAAAERGGFGWSVESASRLYGWYTGLVYLTPILGGYLADRYIGPHPAVLIGGTLIALGHFSLALGGEIHFFAGLSLVIAGTGFFKANISTLLGRLYHGDDARRDAGFTIFYMGINLGALLGPLICGYLVQNPVFGWHYGFGAAGVGMLLGLIVYGIGSRRLSANVKQPIGALGIQHAPLTPPERDRIKALFIIIFFVVFFWLAFEQAGTSMTLFAERNTNRHLPEWLRAIIGIETFPAAWFQAVNPAFILLLAPAFSSLWRRLASTSFEPDTTLKMTWGLALLGLGFAVLVAGAYVSDAGLSVSPFWLIGAYCLHTCGELCLSPVGLSLVSRIAPLKFASMLMGTWFLANFAANLISGYLAGMLESIARGELFHWLGGQADFYVIFVISSTAAAAILLILRPLLNRLMQARA